MLFICISVLMIHLPLEVREVDTKVQIHLLLCLIFILILWSSRRDWITQYSFVFAESTNIHASMSACMGYVGTVYQHANYL